VESSEDTDLEDEQPASEQDDTMNDVTVNTDTVNGDTVNTMMTRSKTRPHSKIVRLEDHMDESQIIIFNGDHLSEVQLIDGALSLRPNQSEGLFMMFLILVKFL